MDPYTDLGNDKTQRPPTTDAADGVDAYLHFNEPQRDVLLADARANAAALLVDAVADADKWQFVTQRGQLQVYELRADAMDRVSSMTPQDPSKLAQHMHTMLATTQVKATLEDFMRLVAPPKKDTFQNIQAALFEERVQLADVFTSFGGLPGGRSGRSSSTSSTGSFTSQQSGEAEQYSVKYVSIKGRAARTNSGTSLNASGANSLKFGGKNRHRERQAARLHKSSKRGDDAQKEEGLTLCIGEYATIRRGQIRGPMAQNQAQDFDDQRIGIISQHSMEDPAVTRYCKPIVTSTASSKSTTNFAVTARALVQFSGIVVYPVASSVAGENVLEVLIKLSCFDSNGITTTRRQNMLGYLSAFQGLDTALLVMRLRESPYLTSENWVKSRKNCCVCQGSFTISRRKHHCRLCGDVTCSKCSDVHQIKLGKAGKCPFRICVNCVGGMDDTQRQSRGRMNQMRVPSTSQPPRTPVNGANAALRGRNDSGPHNPEEDDGDEYNRAPSTNSSSGDSSDLYDSKSLLASQASGSGDRAMSTMSTISTISTMSSMSGSTAGSFNSSRGLDSSYNSKLGAFSRRGSSKTLSISSGSFSSSFYKQSNASNATTMSSSRGSRFDDESENEGEAGKYVESETEFEVVSEISREVEKEPEVDAEFPPVTKSEASADASAVSEVASEVASVCSSSPSSPSSAMMESDTFYKRFSELSLMDFHDSEFDLSIKGGLPGRFTNKSELEVFDFDDSEAGDSDREDLDGIGEEENEDGDEEEVEDICDFDLRELDEADEDDDDSGMEFHDSNVGIDFQLKDLNLQGYQGLDGLEEGDEEFDDEDIVEEIHTNVLSRSRVGSSLDEQRAARLTEYGIMDSGKEHIYDLVAKQAAQHSNCLLATISFVDAQREFIKSSFGLTLSRDRELSEIPIVHSLTAEIMRRFPAHKADTEEFSIDDEDEEDREVVTVLDALQDDVLATNLFVSESPNLRFIMGVPFRARDGVVLGALVVADAQPRTSVSSRQQSLLKDLAEQAPVVALINYVARGFKPKFPKWTLRYELVVNIMRSTHGVRLESVHLNGLEHLWLKSSDVETIGTATKRVVILYYHGGGYAVLSPRAYITFGCSLVAAIKQEFATQATKDDITVDIFLANYRKLPEYQFPVPAEDAVTMYEYVLQHEALDPSQIILAGDSAGGGLVMSTLLRVRDGKSSWKPKLPLPLAAIVECPIADLTDDEDKSKGEHCIVTPSSVEAIRNCYHPTREDPRTWEDASPVQCDLRGLPPLLLQTASFDYLFQHSLRLAAKAKADGVTNWELDVHEDVPHAFMVFPDFVLPYARVGVQRMAAFAVRQFLGVTQSHQDTIIASCVGKTEQEPKSVPSVA
ncbi:hypothetical protein BBI17_007343 [Phytophthora kernoviae]|uniref:FYVE-type domain-containing protein n=2 Tax=Phytophthora kernoviae TaxID=325452 RepID=A0A421EXB2_9STRA|nr:hypothetical protein G195_009822 [Phytophthora kernoviae 00238/432]RLN06818.1 hypothetical protein BBI17_007343 [Phytophthora kernoviae]